MGTGFEWSLRHGLSIRTGPPRTAPARADRRGARAQGRATTAVATLLMVAGACWTSAVAAQAAPSARPADERRVAASLPASTIRMLQHSLMQGGYEVDSTDGVWGPKTEAAVREFQKVRGLASTGRPDPQTLAALGVDDGGPRANAGSGTDAGMGADSQARAPAQVAPRAPADLGRSTILAIQRALDERGLQTGPVDGVWGERTESAIANLQRAHGMAASGDLDPRTLTLLGLLPGSAARGEGAAGPGQGGDPGLDPAAVRLLQQALGRAGQRVAVDGAWGQRTVDHLREFQRERGLPADGRPDVHTLAALGLLPGSDAPPAAR